MKILIVSDTHRKDGNLQWVMEKEKPFDMLIHLGDAEGSEQYIAHWAEPGCELEMVLGNNDFFSHLERERDLMIGKIQNAFNPWPLLSCVFKHRVFKRRGKVKRF